MLRKHTLCILTLCLLSPLTQCWGALQAPAAQKQPKDREEFDLFNNVLKETDPAKKLQLLDQWKQKYPDSAYKDDRLQIYMQTYQQANQLPKAVETANELLGLSPDEFSAYYTIASLTPFLGSTDAKVLGDGEKAANGLLRTLEPHFAPDKKPANVADADWAQGKKAAQIVAHQALGWIAWQQKKLDVGEQEFLKTLELSPTAAQVSYWLGNVLLAQKNPDKYTLTLFSFARAAAFDGTGALAPAGRQQIETFLTKLYTNYHGADPKGLTELKTLAKASHLPPAEFKIKSSAEVEVEKEEELKKRDPLLAFFLTVKQGLTGSDGSKFWESMKGTAMPQMRGTVLTATPPLRPKTFTLAMSQSKEAEVTLILDTPLPRKLDPGAVIEFVEAEPTEFTPSPFMIKMQGGKITSGLPEAPPPPPRKTAPAAKKAGAAAKKKAG